MSIDLDELVCNLLSDRPLLRDGTPGAVEIVTITFGQVLHHVFRSDNPVKFLEMLPFETTSNREATFDFLIIPS